MFDRYDVALAIGLAAFIGSVWLAWRECSMGEAERKQRRLDEVNSIMDGRLQTKR